MNPGTGSAALSNRALSWATHALVPLVLPASLLVGAYLFHGYLNLLPPSLTGLVVYGPYGLLILSALLGAAFGRSKVLLGTTLLLVGHGLMRWTSDQVITAEFARTISNLSLYALLPLNFALVSCYRERGITSGHGNFRITIIATQIAAVAILLTNPMPELGRLLNLDPVPLPTEIQALLPAPLTQVSALLLIVALATVTIRAYWEYTPIAFALLGALIGHLVAALNLAESSASALLISASAMLLTISVLRESYNMAFRDELTGLPQRRALREQMMALAGQYTVAMVDIDHFKKFNDQYGHDVGDQVLQMVAAQINQVKGGGRAYRYGGEEFSIIFPRRTLENSLAHLEELRTRIEEYHMVIREAERPTTTEGGKVSHSRKRGSFREAGKQVSVTVSIGAAERNERSETPDEVLKRSDEALYTAKKKGRNRVIA